MAHVQCSLRRADVALYRPINLDRYSRHGPELHEASHIIHRPILRYFCIVLLSMFIVNTHIIIWHAVGLAVVIVNV